MSLTIKANLDEINKLMDGLSEDVEKAVRPAAQAGSQVIYDAVEVNVAMIGKKSGNLARAIYQVFSADNSGQGRATYHVSWNARKAPHGHLVEYGHLARFHTFIGKNGRWYTDKKRPLAQPRQVAARPFIRPAAAKFDAAVEAAKKALFQCIKGIK